MLCDSRRGVALVALLVGTNNNLGNITNKGSVRKGLEEIKFFFYFNWIERDLMRSLYNRKRPKMVDFADGVHHWRAGHAEKNRCHTVNLQNVASFPKGLAPVIYNCLQSIRVTYAFGVIITEYRRNCIVMRTRRNLPKNLLFANALQRSFFDSLL